MFITVLSDTCVLRLKHLCLTCKTLVSVGLNTCVCHDKGLQLSKQRKDGRPEARMNRILRRSDDILFLFPFLKN